MSRRGEGDSMIARFHKPFLDGARLQRPKGSLFRLPCSGDPWAELP